MLSWFDVTSLLPIALSGMSIAIAVNRRINLDAFSGPNRLKIAYAM